MIKIIRTRFLFVFIFCCNICFAQNDSLPQPPYLKFPTLPPVKLLKADSISFFTREDLPKKHPVILMLFSPDCSHCQHETEEIMKNKEEFKDIILVMATMSSLTQLREFVSRYELDQMKNLIVGQDIYYFMASFYGIRNLPFLAFYDKKGKLISVHQGSLPVADVIRIIKGKK